LKILKEGKKIHMKKEAGLYIIYLPDVVGREKI
jgi:hypothetical protein